jgi:hypothetical protein
MPVGLVLGRAVPAVGEDDEVIPGADVAGAGSPVAPSPLVPAPGCDGAAPPSSTLPAWMIARRTGCTPSERLAMTTIPARPVTSQSTPVRHVPSGPLRGNASLLRLGLSAGLPLRCRGRRASHGRRARVSVTPGQAQCPRQVQNLTRSTAPDRTASSQGRGGRLPMRARMLSSPSAPGSIPLTASDRARRSASSRPSSGEDGPSSTCPPGHGVFCSRVDLSAAIARAV